VIERRTTRTGQVRYEVRLRAPDGRERSRSFPTKREAKAYEAAELARRTRGDWFDPRRATIPFRVVADDWLGSNPAKRPSTRARDEISLRAHLLPRFGSTAVGRIDPDSVQRWVTDHAHRRAARTVKRDYGVLRAVLAHAVDRELIVRSPCRGIRLPDVAPVESHVITPDELERLAAALGPDHSLIVYLGAALGLRWGEVAGLRVGRLDLLRGELTVAEQVTRGEGGRSHLGAPKSRAGRRTLTMPAWLVEMLAEHLRARGLTAADSDAFVFTWPSGGHLTYSAWRRQWIAATAAVGLPEGFGFHDLRRANATELVAGGVDVRTAQARLGHSDVRLTLEVYARATSEADRAAAETVGRHFQPRATDQRDTNRGISRDRRGIGGPA
jgi:integrase